MRVTVKGQVTIPKAVREKLGIKPDSEVDFVEESGRFYLRKVKVQTNPFDQLVGAGTVNMTTDEIMALTRGRTMNRVLVDANVILDVFTKDPIWMNWSKAMLGQYHATHTLLINPVVYAEISIGFEKIETLEQALKIGGFQLHPLSREALFLAGKAFVNYRKRGGARRSPLPDFFVGAQAAVEKLPLLTRDTARYKTDFPTVVLISPDNANPVG